MYMYIYHIFFIHSFADGHLGVFHVLPVVKSAAVSTGVHLFKLEFCLAVCRGMGLLDDMVILSLVF